MAEPMGARYTRLAVTAVAIHLAINVAHGWAHRTIPVPNTRAQMMFIIPVIGVAPLIAAALVLTRRAAAGAWLLAVSMLGSLLFGIVYHYVVRSPDHVTLVPATDAGSVFRSSALALAVTELFGFVIGTWGILRATGMDVARPGGVPPRAPEG